MPLTLSSASAIAPPGTASRTTSASETSPPSRPIRVTSCPAFSHMSARPPPTFPLPTTATLIVLLLGLGGSRRPTRTGSGHASFQRCAVRRQLPAPPFFCQCDLSDLARDGGPAHAGVGPRALYPDLHIGVEKLRLISLRDRGVVRQTPGEHLLAPHPRARRPANRRARATVEHRARLRVI